ncbi:hypothetical protein FOCC_FOCC009003 [Frankliniella occidentalis]|nr:hypothetical protein FOCC_FOCC009003 [Frankliniella occidentalis]
MSISSRIRRARPRISPVPEGNQSGPGCLRLELGSGLRERDGFFTLLHAEPEVSQHGSALLPSVALYQKPKTKRTLVQENNCLKLQLEALTSKVEQLQKDNKPTESYLLQLFLNTEKANLNKKRVQTYSILKLNAPRAVPSISSLKRVLAASKEIPTEGLFRFAELQKFLEERGLPMQVVISEDGTRVQQRVQSNRATNQVVGHVPPLGNDGLPVVQVDRRWKWMKKTAAEHGIHIRAFSSDGDTRLLCAMQSSTFSQTEETCRWKWFQGGFSNEPVCIQDHIHIGTKLASRFETSSIVLPMGNFLASPFQIQSD